jgi:archaeosortase B (VPXXXP-CTERM-specific)
MAQTNGDRPAEGQPTGDGPDPGEAESSASPPSLWPVEAVKAIWRNPAYRFVALFLPYLAAASLGYPLMLEHSDGIIQAFIHATASIEYWLFALFADDVRLDGKMIWFGKFVVKIIDECTGIYEMLIFAAAVLAFPTSGAKRAVGLLLGCPLIYLFNVVRIAGLIWVGRYWSQAFEFMHLYFWQATMIAMITSVWLLWIVKVVQREDQAVPDSD